MEREGKGDAVGWSAWGWGEGGGTVGVTGAYKGSMDQGGRVAAAHEQAGQVLGLGFEVLVTAAQASEAEKLGIGYSSFSMEGVGGGKMEVEVGVSGFEEGGSGNREGRSVDRKRDVEEIKGAVRDGRGEGKGGVKVGDKGDETGEVLARERGGADTVVYVATV